MPRPQGTEETQPDAARSSREPLRQMENLTQPTQGESAFSSLLDEAVGEIRRRAPDYFDRFGLIMPSIRARAERYGQYPTLTLPPETDIEEVLAQGLAHFRKCGITVNENEADDKLEPVAEMLCDSIVDAFAASLGQLSLSSPGTELEGNIAAGYDDRRTREGIRYLVRHSGTRPLVLVNACGMPLSLWSRFMTDKSHAWQVVATESPCTDLFDGGMRSADDLTADVAAIVSALDDAQINCADVLAWCSGARVAIELAGKFPDRVRSLVMISPTLRGTGGVVPDGSAFEDGLDRIFKMVDSAPHRAAVFTDAIRSLFEFNDWDGMANRPDQRIRILLGLSAREHVSRLIAPMTSPNSLVNYGRRILNDQTYPLQMSLTRLRIPIILLVGDYDNRVNNAFTSAVLKAWGVRFTQVSIRGAGHYLHDLQYQYFSAVLSAFISDTSMIPSARIKIDRSAS
jgi:pimeloyl-ACP methyl ester carboxylesterase